MRKGSIANVDCRIIATTDRKEKHKPFKILASPGGFEPPLPA